MSRKLIISTGLFILSLITSLPVFAGTCVFVNGRSLSQAEVRQVAQATGSVPACGAYLYNQYTGHWVNMSNGTAGRLGGGGSSSTYSNYGSVHSDGNGFTGFISGNTSVTCGPDGGCIY